MNDLLSFLGSLFDSTLKKRALVYKLLVGLCFIIVIGLFVRDVAWSGSSE